MINMRLQSLGNLQIWRAARYLDKSAFFLTNFLAGNEQQRIGTALPETQSHSYIYTAIPVRS